MGAIYRAEGRFVCADFQTDREYSTSVRQYTISATIAASNSVATII